MNLLQTAEDLENAFIQWNESFFHYAFLRVRHQTLAEDLVQDTFVKAWEHRDSFDASKSSLKNWLFAILINTLRDYFRKKKIETEELNENIAAKNNLEESAQKNDLIQFVFDKIKNLPERDQELLALRYKSDLSIEEVAELMGLEYSAAKVAIHRALKKLQEICNPS